jgi:hypothetical protein
MVTGNDCGLVKVILGEAVFWHTVVEPPIDAVGVGLTVTVVDAVAEGPLHPFANTLTVATPENDEDHVTVPVVPVPAIELPVPVTDQT